MIYERHNRGRIFGHQAEVCPDSVFDEGSFASDRADIWQSNLIHSRVRGNAVVRRSRLIRSSIGNDDNTPVEVTVSESPIQR